MRKKVISTVAFCIAATFGLREDLMPALPDAQRYLQRRLLRNANLTIVAATIAALAWLGVLIFDILIHRLKLLVPIASAMLLIQLALVLPLALRSRRRVLRHLRAAARSDAVADDDEATAKRGSVTAEIALLQKQPTP
jgi:hypothetical protein